MQKKKIIRITTVCFLFLYMITLPLSGCAAKKSVQEINWDDMHGSWISADGEVIGNHELSIRGSVPVEFINFEFKECELNIILPTDFDLPNLGSKTYYVSSNSKSNATDACPFYVYGSLFNYVPELKEHDAIDFVLFPDDGAVVFEDYENDRYFVASTDPNADLKALLDLCKEHVLLEHDSL